MPVEGLPVSRGLGRSPPAGTATITPAAATGGLGRAATGLSGRGLLLRGREGFARQVFQGAAAAQATCAYRIQDPNPPLKSKLQIRIWLRGFIIFSTFENVPI